MVRKKMEGDEQQRRTATDLTPRRAAVRAGSASQKAPDAHSARA
ncbi:hypothetical protein Ppa06_38530 [Planomonospora parontospora subsp. parontospora]|uniref:Uncharacterized protein n=2 Tax=Planomonospora parontospora TaxID=58119 RepID=A0AA37BIK7_9ACTN|nr:hypothetical protein [Planomonospora parontospora]GGK77023.1 hypothetical protein GCM10010126_40380 [Planomonospora parontospora]GII10055.1 hypothetical protein Ppa06_38530 [Planomonospora parontospora subsp. parontospora]